VTRICTRSAAAARGAMPCACFGGGSSRRARASAHDAASAGDCAALSASLARAAAHAGGGGVKAACDERDVDGDTPLHRAALAGATDAASLLLASGAAVDATNAHGAPRFLRFLCRRRRAALCDGRRFVYGETTRPPAARAAPRASAPRAPGSHTHARALLPAQLARRRPGAPAARPFSPTCPHNAQKSHFLASPEHMCLILFFMRFSAARSLPRLTRLRTHACALAPFLRRRPNAAALGVHGRARRVGSRAACCWG
jgi:hypothetical protein